MPDKLPPSTWPSGPAQITRVKLPPEPIVQDLTARPLPKSVSTQIMQGKTPVKNSHGTGYGGDTEAGVRDGSER